MAGTPRAAKLTFDPVPKAGLALTVRSRPRVLFLGSTYAGHRTRFENLRQHLKSDSRMRPRFRSVNGWDENGWIEALPLVAKDLKGKARAVCEAAAIAQLPRPDVIWTSCREEISPYAWTQMGPMRRPLVLELDATDSQLESMAQYYFDRPPKSGWKKRIAGLEDAMVRRGVTLFLPWSDWAAEGLRQEGVREEMIRILPPGVDLSVWQPASKSATVRPLRVLFVGGNFHRKGGDLLVESAKALAEQIDLVLVTQDEVTDLPPNARVEHAEPNSAALQGWYTWADIFVLPSRAECFGIATIEAMAAGLPTIVSNVGGVRDIVVDGMTGWIVDPSGEGVRAALRAAVANRASLPSLGARGRSRAEARFDGLRNDMELLEILLELGETRSDGRRWG